MKSSQLLIAIKESSQELRDRKEVAINFEPLERTLIHSNTYFNFIFEINITEWIKKNV